MAARRLRLVSECVTRSSGALRCASVLLMRQRDVYADATLRGKTAQGVVLSRDAC